MNMNEFAGASEWKREFGFLDKCGLATVYLTILGLAQSNRDIRKLVELLPDYCRLLRNDVIKFEAFWLREVTRPDKCEPRERSEDELNFLRWLLGKQCPDKKVSTGYYVDALKTAQTDQEFAGELRGEYNLPGVNVLSHESRLGHGYAHFRTMLDRVDVDLEVWVTPDQYHLVVRIPLWQTQLTEELTHYFLGKMPPFMMVGEGLLSSEEGRQMLPSYCLPAANFFRFLDGGNPCYTVLPEFAENLASSLRAMGIPLAGDIVAISKEAQS